MLGTIELSATRRVFWWVTRWFWIKFNFFDIFYKNPFKYGGVGGGVGGVGPVIFVAYLNGIDISAGFAKNFLSKIFSLMGTETFFQKFYKIRNIFWFCLFNNFSEQHSNSVALVVTYRENRALQNDILYLHVLISN